MTSATGAGPRSGPPPQDGPGRAADSTNGDGGEETTADAEADAEAIAREIVLRQLTVRARTRQELRSALDRRRVPAEAAEAVLDRMSEVGLVDDTAFAEGWVRSRQQRRNLSGRALRHELQRKGVEADIVTEAVAEVQPEDEYTAALALAQRKARTMAGLEPVVRRRRLAGALARKGFAGGIVYQVLAEVEEVPEEDHLTDPTD